MPITFNVTIVERGRPNITRSMTRGVDAVSDEARNAAIRAAAAAAAANQDKDLEDAPPSVATNLSVSPIVTILSNQYIATINPGLDGEIPGNDIGLDYGSNDRQVDLTLSLQQLISDSSTQPGQIDITLSRTATQDVGINLGLPSSMSTSSDFDA
tara:strand:+ start:1639 stop:2103 length:465 start_codon:yes stop_codon:yes gene_type:complete